MAVREYGGKDVGSEKPCTFPNDPSVCSQCEKQFNSPEHLELHTKSIHFDHDDKHLDSCAYKIPHHQNLVDPNLSIVKNETAYQCPYCNNAFDKPSALDTHIETVHSADLCEISNESDRDSGTSTLPELSNCEDLNVSSCKNITCSLCMSDFASAIDLTCHISTKHSDILSKHDAYEQLDLYTCAHCLKGFQSQEEHDAHLKQYHIGGKSYICSECGKFLTSPQGLKKHMRSHTGERPYQCRECGKSFMQSGHLQAHTRLHTKERPYKCPECDLAFTTSSAMRRHLNLHTGVRPFRCGICEAAFNTSWHLKQHVKEKHLGIKNEKSHECAECGKKCSRPHDLTLHMQVHTGVKLYKCKSCDRSFCRSTLLRNHARKYHPKQGILQKTLENESIEDSSNHSVQ